MISIYDALVKNMSPVGMDPCLILEHFLMCLAPSGLIQAFTNEKIGPCLHHDGQSMSIYLKQLTVAAEQLSDQNHIISALESAFGMRAEDIHGYTIKKKSIDARRKARIVCHYQLEIAVKDEPYWLKKHQTSFEAVVEKPKFHPLDSLDVSSVKSLRAKPVIVGSGPSGIFSALVLAEAGIPCVVVERGEPVEQRLKTVNKLRSRSIFSEQSNYCFGEGGAGTFSDGKLTCGRNHPLIRYLFEKWVEFGAPGEILYDAHPHIGTDFLMLIAKRMREYLKARGVEFMFSTRLETFKHRRQASKHICRFSLELEGGLKLETDHLILAIGHSARDTYQKLLDLGLAIQPKPFAIGARIEHPQHVIDEIQYGSCSILPSAEYKLTSQSSGRGIWTFCMCPGGHLLPTSAQADHLAINGMSYHARTSGFANAAVVVGITREDYYKGGTLDGADFQANIEKQAFKQGGGSYYTPAQRLSDFIKGRSSKGELKSTYKPGVTSARLDKILPEFVVKALQAGLTDYNNKMKGYLCDDAIVAGVETKTSSPIVMMRNKNLQSISHSGLFPCGEGAGFAGGIVSASLDGVRVARAVVEDVLENKNVFWGS